MNEFIRLTK